MTLADGQDVRGIDVRMSATAVHRVRTHIETAGSRPVDPNTLAIRLVPKDAEDTSVLSIAPSALRPEGDVEFAAVAAGDYVLQVSASLTTIVAPAPLGAPQTLAVSSAFSDIRARGGDAFGLVSDALGWEIAYQREPDRPSYWGRAEVVTDEEDRDAALLELPQLGHAALLETRVSDGERFVHDEDVRIDVDHHRECQPHVHAGGIRLYRHFDEIADVCEFHDAADASANLRLGQPQHSAVEKDVFPAGEFGIEPRAELQQRAMRPFSSTEPDVGVSVPQISCSSVDLPEPLRPTMPTVEPWGTSNVTSWSAQKSRWNWRRPLQTNCFRRSPGRS